MEPGRYQPALRRLALVSTGYDRPTVSSSKPTTTATIGGAIIGGGGIIVMMTVVGGGGIIVTMMTAVGGGGIIAGLIAMTINDTHGGIAMIGTIATIGASASGVAVTRRLTRPPVFCMLPGSII